MRKIFSYCIMWIGVVFAFVACFNYESKHLLIGYSLASVITILAGIVLEKDKVSKLCQ